MRILLLRHADAGDRSLWTEDDRLRPVSPKGQKQAERLLETLLPMGPVRVLTSPYVRCVQTVEPLANRAELVVEETGALAEAEGPAALRLLRELAGQPGPASAIACTHGDVIAAVLAELRSADGLDIGPSPQSKKASTWVLEPGERGRIARAIYLRPPK